VNIYLAIRHALQCVWLLLTRRPHVVYLQLSQALLPFLRDCLFLVPALALRRRVVVHLHGSAFRSVYEAWPAWARFLARICLRRVARVVVLCARLTGLFTGLVPERRIVVIPNGIQRWVHSAISAGPGRDTGHVLYVGSLSVGKGVLDILRAMPQVIRQHPHVRFVFAGEWRDRESCRKARQWIGESGLEGHVRFCGPVAGAAKERLFCEASMLLAPSYNEGQPFVVLEAMAAGLPVISTPVGCLPDMVEDGVTGFLVAAGDCGQLADRICRLLADARMRRRMGQAGQEKCLSHFKSERMMADLCALFAEVAGASDDGDGGV
jgi:glycosyltransferase involved in cell wall biosynthesis